MKIKPDNQFPKLLCENERICVNCLEDVWRQKDRRLKADSHSMQGHAVPLPCHAAKGLDCVFPIWFTQCGRVWFTLAMLRPCRSSQGHGTARPSREGLWATCPRSASSGYHAEFHEGCYQKHTNLKMQVASVKLNNVCLGRGKEW